MRVRVWVRVSTLPNLRGFHRDTPLHRVFDLDIRTLVLLEFSIQRINNMNIQYEYEYSEVHSVPTARRPLIRVSVLGLFSVCGLSS